MKLRKAVPFNRGVSQGRADDSTFCTVQGGMSGAQREGTVGTGQLPRPAARDCRGAPGGGVRNAPQSGSTGDSWKQAGDQGCSQERCRESSNGNNS